MVKVIVKFQLTAQDTLHDKLWDNEKTVAKFEKEGIQW